MVLPFVRDLFTDVEKLPAFSRVASHLKEGTGRIRVSGLIPTAKAVLFVMLQKAAGRPLIIVVQDNRAADDLVPVLQAFCELTGAADPASVVSLSNHDVLPFQNLSLTRRSRRNGPSPCGRLRPALHRLWFRQLPPPRFACARLSITPIWRGPCAAVKCSTSTRSSFTSTRSDTTRPMWWKCPENTPFAAAFWTCTHRKTSARCESSFSGTRSSPSGNLIPRRSVLRTPWMKRCCFRSPKLQSAKSFWVQCMPASQENGSPETKRSSSRPCALAASPCFPGGSFM